jgi:hypothetical protein
MSRYLIICAVIHPCKLVYTHYVVIKNHTYYLGRTYTRVKKLICTAYDEAGLSLSITGFHY